MGEYHRRQGSDGLKKSLDAIDCAVAVNRDVHLVTDNCQIHKTRLTLNSRAERPSFPLRFTPTSVSWLNLVERWSASGAKRQIRREIHRSARELETTIERFGEAASETPRSFVWTKSADWILVATGHFRELTPNSGL